MKMYSIGRITESKDLVTQIKAIKELIDNKIVPNPELEIYGEPITEKDEIYKAKLIALVKDLGIEDSVFFMGGKKHNEIL